MKRLVLIAICCFFVGRADAQTTEASAQKLYDEGRYQPAVNAFEELIAKKGREVPLLLGLGKSLYGLKESRRSQSLFQEVITKDKTNSSAPYWIGRILNRRALDGMEAGKTFATADLRDAVIFYREAAALAKDPFAARFAAGRALMYLLDFDQALNELKKAQALRPDNKAVAAHVLGALYRSGRFAEFLEMARKHPESIDRLREFDAVIRLGRDAEAKTLFVELIENHGYSERTQAYDMLARACADLRKPQLHLAILKDLIAKQPDESYAIYYLGYKEALEGLNEAAEKHFRQYLNAAPNAWVPKVHLARVLTLERKLREAEAVIRDVASQQPAAKEVRDGVATLVLYYVERKDFAHALTLHQLLLDMDGENPQIRRDHAILLKETGKLDEAVAMLQAVCDAESVEGFRLSDYWNDLGLCLKGRGSRKEAIQAFKKAMAVFSFNSNARENLGVMYFQDGSLDKAEIEFRGAIKGRGDRDSENSDKNWRPRYYLRLIKSARIGVPQGGKTSSEG